MRELLRQNETDGKVSVVDMPEYAQYRRAFYQAIVAADVWRGLGVTLGIDTQDNVTDCVRLAASILAEAPDELVREIKRSQRIVSTPRG